MSCALWCAHDYDSVRAMMPGATGRKMTRARIVGMMRYLMMQPRTKSQLAKFAGVSRNTANHWINDLHRVGCIHVSGYTQTLRNGFRASIYAWGYGDDAVRPAPMTGAQRVAKCRDRSTLDRAWRMPRTVHAPSHLPGATGGPESVHTVSGVSVQ